MLIADEVKRIVDMKSVCQHLGIEVTKSGFCSCPFHGQDKHPSMKVYPESRGFCCFTCGEKGSVIDFVMKYNSCSFWKAVEWLNSAFNLGLPLDRPLDKNAAEAARRAKERKQTEREQKQAIERMEFDLYVLCGRLLESLEADKERYRPRTANEEWDDRFVNAVKLIPEAEEIADDLAVRVIGVKSNDGR